MINIKINLPENVNYIIGKLEANGFEAYAVGGCVRDSILNIKSSDWDITTNAEPQVTKNLFEKTVDTGIKHGTVAVIKGSEKYEVTTFRVDGKYTDFRKPDKVLYTKSLIEDLSRRDFTINAIAYNHNSGITDPFNGLTDLNNKIIKTVGKPLNRFNEDALRMMRAVRFSAQLNFNIDIATAKSIRYCSHLIRNISQERIRDELTKIILSEHPEKFKLLKTLYILQYILPELEPCFGSIQNNPYHVYDVADHILKTVSHIDQDRILKWTMLLHDIGKPAMRTTDMKGIDHFYGHQKQSVVLANEILTRLKFDSKSAQTIYRLIEHHDRKIEESCLSIRKTINVIGEDIFIELLKVKEADFYSQNPKCYAERLATLNKIRELYNNMKSSKQFVSNDDLLINGKDLIDAGYLQGKSIGKALKKALDLVIENPDLNTKEQLLNILKNELMPKQIE